MEKEKLREQLRLKRKKLSLEEVEAKSRLIIERLVADVDWSKIGTLHMYQPISSLAEIDTNPLLKFLADNHPEIRVVTQSASRLAATEKQKFDLIIVPTLGFDQNCNRLGWGGGWYDRFLVNQPQALKIGLAYQDSQIADGLPAEPHDIRLDKIVTEAVVFNQ